VLLVGDSLFWGSAFIPGNPQLMPHLVPRLAAEGVEARLIGGPAETPVEQGWPRKVRAEVEAWDPDLVVLASVIPTGVREDRRRRRRGARRRAGARRAAGGGARAGRRGGARGGGGAGGGAGRRAAGGRPRRPRRPPPRARPRAPAPRPPPAARGGARLSRWRC